MTQFDESKIRRDGEGKFATKGPAAEADGVELGDPASGDEVGPTCNHARAHTGCESCWDKASEWQRKFATEDYLPVDPDSPRVEDQLRALEGPQPTHDQWGNKLARGGFPRDRYQRALVTDPSGAVDSDGKPVLIHYGTPSGAAVKSSSDSLMDWKSKAMVRAFQDPAFSNWAYDQFARIETPTWGHDRYGKPEATYKDLDWSEDKVMSRVKGQAEFVSQTSLAADRGTVIHWVSEQVDAGRDWRQGEEIAAEQGLRPEHLEKFAAAYQKFNEDRGLRPLASEVSVVNDTDRKAGTTDRITELTKPLKFTDADGNEQVIPAGTRMIADVKSSGIRTKWIKEQNRRVPAYRGGYAAQMASYADATPYDPVTGERSEWPDGKAPDPNWGLLVQCESDSVARSKPEIKLEVIDLNKGRAYARASEQLRAAEKVADGASVYASW